MLDFIAQYETKFKERINRDMFTRAYDRPLVEYILDSCRNLEVIPAIKLVGWEFITDQTKIRTEIDKKNSKDPKIKNNRALERLAQPNRTLYDLLILHFRVTAKGRTADVTRKVRVLKQVKGLRYIRNGKRVMLLNQVVDNSTYVKKNVLNFKTTLYPIMLSTLKCKIKFIDGESMIVPRFNLDLFSKETNPLIYYLAHYGLEGTIELFNLNQVMAVTNEIFDEDTYLYLQVGPRLYIEVHEKAFYGHEFIPKFVATLYDALVSDKSSNITLKNVYDIDYWKGRLAEVFSKKRNPEKGDRVMISFAKMMDPFTKRRLKLRKFHKRNTWTIIRWMMVNYEQLLQKDSNDLRYKRVRANEVLAYYFDYYITRNVYSLLNTDNPPFDKYLKLLNSINEFTLIRSTQSSDKSSPSSMFRYEQFNDADFIDISRYTLKGPTGLNGGKQEISLKYRNIYPSQYGRYDLNVCSSSDPGLTGYLTANVKLDRNGYFDSTNNEPDSYESSIDAIIEQYGSEEYAKARHSYNMMELSRDANNFIRLTKKLKGEALWQAMREDPYQYGLYWSDGFLKLIPKMERNQKGFIVLTKKTPSKKPVGKSDKNQVHRDPDGFIRLHRVVTKMEAKGNRRKK